MNHDTLPCSTASPDAGGTAPEHIELRIVGGVHHGAVRTCHDRDVILVGSGDDCDLVLADAGVAAHHALITLLGRALYVRAVDAPAQLGDTMLAPGDPAELAAFAPLALGDATLMLGPGGDPRWRTRAEDAPAKPAGRPVQPVASRRAFRRLHAVAAVAVLSLASVGLYAAVREPAAAGPPDRHVQVAQLIEQMGFEDVRGVQRSDGSVVVSGTVPDTDAREALQKRLRQAGIDADMSAVLTGTHIAESVKEMLRLYGGLAAQTHYLGNGRVGVSGDFTEQDMARTLAHPDIETMVGFTAAVPEGLRQASEAPAQATASAHIVSVVRGDDPYLIASDSSRYYQGSTLPDGSHLDSIGQDIWVIRGGRLQRLALAGSNGSRAAPRTLAGGVAGAR